MTSPPAGTLYHERFYFTHRIIPANKQGMRHDGVANVEFFNTSNRSDFLDIVVMQAMPGIDRQAERYCMYYCLLDAAKFMCLCSLALSIGKGASVQLNHWRTRRFGRINLINIRRDKQGNTNA